MAIGGIQNSVTSYAQFQTAGLENGVTGAKGSPDGALPAGLTEAKGQALPSSRMQLPSQLLNAGQMTPSVLPGFRDAGAGLQRNIMSPAQGAFEGMAGAGMAEATDTTSSMAKGQEAYSPPMGNLSDTSTQFDSTQIAPESMDQSSLMPSNSMDAWSTAQAPDLSQTDNQAGMADMGGMLDNQMDGMADTSQAAPGQMSLGDGTEQSQAAPEASTGQVLGSGKAPAGMPKNLWHCCVAAGKKTGVDPYILAAQMEKESRFGQALGDSESGGDGLMQVEQSSRATYAPKFQEKMGHAYNHGSKLDQVAMAAVMLADKGGSATNMLEKYNGGDNWKPGTTDSFSREIKPCEYATSVIARAEAMKSGAA